MKSAIEIDAGALKHLQDARHLVVFTGSGVSQESGIPTFRDAQVGLWAKYDPNELATPEAFAKQRDVVWGWYEFRRSQILRCQPNPGHQAIEALARHLPKLTLITQNVDDLHERAGSHGVIHLHGSIFQPRCRACGRPHTLTPGIPDLPSEVQQIMPPKCNHCGGWIRPGVVWFGEELPRNAWSDAKQAVRECDVLLCVGTSAVVYPAAALPFEAAEQGVCVIQVNPDPTSLDSVARFNLRGRAGEVLPALVEAAWGS